MSDLDVAARLRELPPELLDPADRFQQVQERVRRRRVRRLIGTGVGAVAACSLLAVIIVQFRAPDPAGEPSDGFATDQTSPPSASSSRGELAPGTDRVVELSAPLTTRGAGSKTVQLGERPSASTAVSTDLSCLTAGTFQWPDGASLSCSAEDAATAKGRAVSPGYVIDLEPGQTEITITAGPGESWEIVTVYVRTERVEWGVNANGATYGVENEDGSPDLIAVEAPGQKAGYARSADLNASPSTPDEASVWMENGQPYAIPTYASDGTTIVGTFGFSEANNAGGGSSDLRLVNGSPPPGTDETSATGLLTVTNDGCLHLDTSAGTRWLILPWGVHVAGTSANGRLQALDATPIADLNADASFSGEQLLGQKVDAPCGTDLPPLYVTAP